MLDDTNENENIQEWRLSMLDGTNEDENMRKDGLIAGVLGVGILYR